MVTESRDLSSEAKPFSKTTLFYHSRFHIYLFIYYFFAKWGQKNRVTVRYTSWCPGLNDKYSYHKIEAETTKSFDIGKKWFLFDG